MHTVELYCVPCQANRLFEQPPCEDDHGQDCAELACVVCGHALLIGPLLAIPATQQAHPASSASQQHAA